MTETFELFEKPQAQTIVMLCGWRQWADAGSISSGLPHYLVQQANARKIGALRPEGFYLFQFPGTHDLVRPMVRFEQGYPRSLDVPTNEIFYAGDEQLGIVIFLGDEPHMDVERYVGAVLDIAKTLGVRRIVSFGGVYGELPYDRERMVSSIYSLPRLKTEVNELAVNLSDYQGGASIGSYLCRRAGERDVEFVGFYAFVPTYDFSHLGHVGRAIRIENDFMAWLGVMRRVNFMLKTRFDLADLEDKTQRLLRTVDSKVEELDNASPQLNIRQYMQRLSDDFEEVTFDALDNIWEQELRRLFDDTDVSDIL